jgi:hypothetical protein
MTTNLPVRRELPGNRSSAYENAITSGCHKINNHLSYLPLYTHELDTIYVLSITAIAYFRPSYIIVSMFNVRTFAMSDLRFASTRLLDDANSVSGVGVDDIT